MNLETYITELEKNNNILFDRLAKIAQEINKCSDAVSEAQVINGIVEVLKEEFIEKDGVLITEAKGGPKFKVGDVVNYIPKLSGLNPNKKLEIIRVRYANGDRFTKPGWYYSFKGMDLSSAEKDIKLA